jgi:putative Mg2+ transporter-C (MgtC) family protein
MIVQEVIRLLAAAALGSLIGFERERLDRGAGLRTHALVATASALIMLVSSYGFADVVTRDRTVVLDPSRIAAQVVSGIGFLGAGLIIFRRNVVYGLTTAASVWAVAAIGLACGAGLFIPAAVTTGLFLVILTGLKPVEQRLFAHKRVAPVTIRLHRQDGQIAAIEEAVRASGLEMQRLAFRPDAKKDESTVTLELREGNAAHMAELAERLQAIPGVKDVTFSRLKWSSQATDSERAGNESG